VQGFVEGLLLGKFLLKNLPPSFESFSFCCTFLEQLSLTTLSLQRSPSNKEKAGLNERCQHRQVEEEEGARPRASEQDSLATQPKVEKD